MGSTSAANQSSMSNVFVYGSLLSDDVVMVLLRRVPTSAPAFLSDYQRFSIKGRVYPAILPIENKKVDGKVLIGITPPELHILDAFEDDEYERTSVEVFLKDSSAKFKAHTYIWGNKTDPDLHGEWVFEEWESLHLEYFLEMTKGFISELELPDPRSRIEYVSSYQEADDNL